MMFRGEFWFLSNMARTPITYKQYKFENSEAFFQACKDGSKVAMFQGVDGPTAKRLGRRVNLRPDWEKVKVRIMEKVVRMKFEQHPELLERLKAIPGEIVEDNTWNDTFWGRCNGRGRNELGKILMKIRDEH